MKAKHLLTLLIPALAVPATVPAAEGEYSCLIEPSRRIEVRSPVEALVHAVHVDRGEHVEEGEVLVELDSRVERAALEAARYRAVMRGELEVAQARLDYSRNKLERQEKLREQQFVSPQERDEAVAEAQVAEAELALARENQRLAGLEVQRLRAAVSLRSLEAPFSGVVTERLQNPGELAQTGEGSRPILKLARIDPLKVEVLLPVGPYGSLGPGMQAVVVPEPPLTGEYRAEVEVVDQVVDSASGTFGVRLRLPNPDGDLPVGVKCTVRFIDGAVAAAGD